ncbi:MAG: protein kinase [Cyanobacteria bacterium RI_101]|nr:protein kinase [Cyanobacteria bacterium RI_101]
MAPLPSIALQPLFPRSRYRILGQIGQGQFGQVYCAVERRSGRLYALKDLEHRVFPTNKFLRELTYLVTLRHPNIVACYAVEYHASGRYLVMDYCEGGTLRELMDLDGDIALVHKIKIIQEILAGLEQAHRANIIHCDLKPENILLIPQTDGWQVKVSDFGIARLTEVTGNPNFCKGYTGSPAYMAPERFYGKFSVASDLYAVGILLYELLTGERPFSGLPGELQTAHLNRRLILPPTVPPALAPIVTKALEKLPQKRFATAQEMGASLAQAALQCVSQGAAAPLLLPPTQTVYEPQNLDSQPLAFRVSRLATEKDRIYLALGDQLSCWRRRNGAYHSEWDLGFALPILDLQVNDSQMLVLTCQKTSIDAQNSKYFNFYKLSDKIAYSRQENKVKVTWKTSHLVYSFDPEGQWIATATPRPSKGEKGVFQLYSAPLWKPRSAELPILFPSQLISLDQRHGLLIFLAQSQGRKISAVNLFNRRGRLLRAFSLDFWLSSLITNPYSRNHLFGLAVDDKSVGVLLRLQPLKVIRVPLTHAAQFIAPYPWGYLLAGAGGEMMLIDYEGFYLGQFRLPEPITALTPLGRYGCLATTWTGERGNLYHIDLGEKIERLIQENQELR